MHTSTNHTHIHTQTHTHIHCQLHKTACSTQLPTHLRVGADAHADKVMQELPVEGSHGRQRVLNHPLLQSQRREQCTTTIGWVYKHHHMHTLVRTQCFRAYQGVREWRGCYSITGHGAYVCMYVGSCTSLHIYLHSGTHLMLNVHKRHCSLLDVPVEAVREPARAAEKMPPSAGHRTNYYLAKDVRCTKYMILPSYYCVCLCS